MSFANKSEVREEKYDLTMTCWQDMQMEMKMEMEIGDAYVYELVMIQCGHTSSFGLMFTLYCV